MDCSFVQAHIEPFDVLIDRIGDVCRAALPEQFVLADDYRVELHVRSAYLSPPSLDAAQEGDEVVSLGRDRPLLPAECRQRAITYGSALKVGD